MSGKLGMVLALACEVDTTRSIISLRLDKCCEEAQSAGRAYHRELCFSREPEEGFCGECVSVSTGLCRKWKKSQHNRSFFEAELDFSAERSLVAGGSEIREVKGSTSYPRGWIWAAPSSLFPGPLLIAWEGYSSSSAEARVAYSKNSGTLCCCSPEALVQV